LKTIFLTGFMGSGKTTVGRRLAAALGRHFMDLDAAIAGSSGHSVSSLLREDEALFRKLESAALRRVAQKRGWVVALGGGTLLDERNLRLVRRSGTLVWLTAPQTELRLRIKKTCEKRPLLATKTLRELIAPRRAGYATASLRTSTAGRTPAQATRRIIRKLRDRGL
jgi:shikimate kinase